MHQNDNNNFRRRSKKLREFWNMIEKLEDNNTRKTNFRKSLDVSSSKKISKSHIGFNANNPKQPNNNLNIPIQKSSNHSENNIHEIKNKPQIVNIERRNTFDSKPQTIKKIEVKIQEAEKYSLDESEDYSEKDTNTTIESFIQELKMSSYDINNDDDSSTSSQFFLVRKIKRSISLPSFIGSGCKKKKKKILLNMPVIFIIFEK